MLDCVDDDELHPYSSRERVRKDLSAAFVLAKGVQNNGEKERCVTLHHVAFGRLHYPQFSISDLKWQDVQPNTTSWGEAMIQSIRSFVHGFV